MSEPFVFGVPLIARAVAHDWALVDRLLGLTLRSVLAQTDRDFRLILAAHDEPACWAEVAADPRFELIRADWPPEPPSGANDDGGAKKWLVKARVRDLGGGLLMFLDADDWVERTLVAAARAAIGPKDIGGILHDGLALDWPSLAVARFPLAGVYDGPFHGLCGSSTIGRVSAAHPDPHLTLGSHHEWAERARDQRLSLAAVPARAMYLVGTGQNHSEREGPFADWRGAVTRAVRARGTPLEAGLAARFGQAPGRL